MPSPPPTVTPSAAALTAGRQVCARLDPLMTAVGSQAGSVGYGADEVGVVFCAQHAEFRSRFPGVAPDIDQPDDNACTDLNVYVDVRNQPRLAEVHLDGHGVDTLLADVGRDDLVTAAHALGRRTVRTDLDRLHGLLLEIFGRAASPAARKDWE
ncbi:hypothetical protein [Georgenia sp. H159]|uniref:hypothetical protein n=1 Tax=Georgenia sp. H159 TaxID=3076115 RepID=UPI002D79EDDA|nr:hypothetical protein [Georgenia sp. H159]